MFAISVIILSFFFNICDFCDFLSFFFEYLRFLCLFAVQLDFVLTVEDFLI